MILAIAGIISLFILAFMVPFLSFLLPVYKIKKMEGLDGRRKLIANLAAMGIISIVDLRLLPFYIGIFLVIETLYYYFKKVKPEVAIFDRIMISTSIVTVFTIGLTLLLVGNVTEMLEVNKAMYMKVMDLETREANEIFQLLKENSIFIVFIYSFICNYLTYFTLESKTYRGWDMSYKWILLYIVTFFATTVGKIENFYVENIFNISKLIYVVFGVKVIYTILRGRAKRFRGLAKMTAVLTAATFPTVVFLLGALKSFNIKLSIQKK